MASLKKQDEGPTIAPRTTALVPHAQPDRDGWKGQQPFRDQRQYNHELRLLWFQLRMDWSSLVIVPSEPDCSTAGLARALCQVGTRLSVHPIEFLEANELDLESSSRLIARLGASGRIAGPTDDGASPASSWAQPITKTIVAVESPLANPLAVPISLAADGIVLCVRRGQDRIASVRETIAALGPERILCCVLLDHAAPGKTNG
jgi:hypothetical protein